jgi:hypothetical protein
MYRARFDTAAEIGLEELIEGVAEVVRPDDFETMEACGPLLAGYAKKPGILSGLVNDTVKNLLSDRVVAPIRTPQSFLLAVHELFYIRCNVWMPLPANIKSKAYQERLYSLEVPHDHNFSFLTVGYTGPGYQTDLFEYDRKMVKGQVGEEVELRPAGSFTLAPGDVMLYRQGIDVHTQHQPLEISASINVMFLSEYNRREWQYLFDLQSNRITGLTGNAMRSRHEMMALAGEVGSLETLDYLQDVSRKCPCPLTRQAALEAFGKLETALC